MTKRFALSDTSPNPYFTIDAGAAATLVVKVWPCPTDGERVAVEVWRDQMIICRVFGKSVQVADSGTAPRGLPRVGSNKLKTSTTDTGSGTKL